MYRGILEACPPDLLSISCMVKVSWILYDVAFQDFWTEFILSTNSMLFVYGSFMSLEIVRDICYQINTSINQSCSAAGEMKSPEIQRDKRRSHHKRCWHNQTLTVCARIQAWYCGRFAVGWAAPSSQWNRPSYSPKHREPNRASSDRSNWSPLTPAENTRHTQKK